MAAEAAARQARGDAVTVLAPGPGSTGRGCPPVHWLPGGEAFGWPGALARLRERPDRAIGALAFVAAARRALAGLAALGQVDEVIAHWIVPSAWPIAANAQCTLEVVAHGSDVRLIERLPRWLRVNLVRDLLGAGASFRFVSSELRHRLVRATFPELLARSRVEPSPIDVSGTPARGAARAELGLREGERVAVVVGRLVASKRPHAAVRLALEQRPDRVVIIGDGPLTARLRRLGDPRVTLTGLLPRAHALTWIAAADLLVAASRDEGSPTSVREARTLGTPVLAVESGDLRTWAARDPGITLVDA